MRSGSLKAGATSGAAEESRRFVSRMGHISRQSGVFLAGSVFTTALGFAFKVYVARVLGAEPLGLFALAMTVVAFFSMLAGMGLPTTASRFVPFYVGQGRIDELHSFLRRCLSVLGLSSLALGCLVVALRKPIAEGLFHEAQLARYLPLAALLIPAGTILLFLGQVVRGYQDVARRTLVESFVQFPVRVILTVAFLAAGFGLTGYLGGEVLSMTGALVLMAWVTAKLTPRVKGRAGGKGERIRGFAASVFGMNLLNFLKGNTDRILLGIFLSARDLGIYSIALATAAYVPTLHTSVRSIFGPLISELHARGEISLLERLFQTLTKWMVGFTAPLMLCIVVFAPEFMGIFGRGFVEGWPVLLVLGLGQFFSVGTGTVGQMLLMSGHQRLELLNSILSTTLIIVLNVLLVPSWGVMGAATALAAGIILSNLYRLWQVRRVLGLTPYNRTFLKLGLPLFLSLAGLVTVRRLAVVTGLPGWSSVLGGLAVAYVLFVAAAFLAALDDDDRLFLSAVAERLRGRFAKVREGEGT